MPYEDNLVPKYGKLSLLLLAIVGGISCVVAYGDLNFEAEAEPDSSPLQDATFYFGSLIGYHLAMMAVAALFLLNGKTHHDQPTKARVLGKQRLLFTQWVSILCLAFSNITFLGAHYSMAGLGGLINLVFLLWGFVLTFTNQHYHRWVVVTWVVATLCLVWTWVAALYEFNETNTIE